MKVRFDSLPVAAMLAADDRVIAVNKPFENLVGVSAAELVGKTAQEVIQRFIPASDLPLVYQMVMGVREGSTPVGDLWCRIIDGQGRGRAVRIVWQPKGEDEAAAVYLLEADDSDTTRVTAEALARAGGDLVGCKDEQEVLEHAVAAVAARGFTTTALLLREGDPLLAYGPSRAAGALGVPTSSPDARIQARPPREVLALFNPRFHERRAAYFQNGKRLVDGAFSEVVADNLKRMLPGQRMVQAPLFVDNQPYGALVVTSDALTPSLAGTLEMFAELVARAIESVRARASALARLRELEQLQNALVQRERLAALGEAAAVMAHEVRNPISAILNAMVLLRRAPEGEHAPKLFEVIAEESARLERVVRDLLDLGRPLSPSRRSVAPRACVEESLRVIAQRELGRVEIRFVNQGPDITIQVDPHLLEMALVNVITNAVQASPPGAEVEVSVEARDGQCFICVDDAGPGFGAADVERLFQPFFTTRPTGTGIGLAVVRRAVEANLGTISLCASASGGARVCLAFPLEDREAVAQGSA
ncbi:MAG: PAS domain-containing protein [Deltaproteobacteria bacterium]|nr:PAS domain-containing protein [Deltaproteobacteria bacterium]